MPQVDILIQGRSYAVQCAEGEEKRAHFLAAHINRHAARLVARLGAMPDAQLLLMTGMVVADELLEAQENLQQLQGQQQAPSGRADAPPPAGEAEAEGDAEDAPADAGETETGGAMAARIETASQRLERIAALLEPQEDAVPPPQSPDATGQDKADQAGG